MITLIVTHITYEKQVALYAGGYEQQTGPCLPVALTFSKYYARAVANGEAYMAPPEEGECVLHSVMSVCVCV